MNRKFGDLLIICSLLLLLYIYYPLLTAYLPNSNTVLASDSKQTISIPKINALAPIIENVDPKNELEYEQILQKGVAEAKGFGKPGEGRLVYIFAHSSLSPWQMTRTNTPFLRLGELQNGDVITISQVGQKYNYQVFDKKEFWPNQTEIFNQEKDKNELILQTCTPIGTDIKRLLVFAMPI